MLLVLVLLPAEPTMMPNLRQVASVRVQTSQRRRWPTLLLQAPPHLEMTAAENVSELFLLLEMHPLHQLIRV